MRKFLPAIGIILLAWYCYLIDWSKAATAAKDLDPWRLALGLGVAALGFLGLIGLRIVRFRSLLPLGIDIPTAVILSVTVRAGFLGMVTPGRLGDASRIWMLEEYNIDATTGFGMWFYERCLDVVSLFALAMTGYLAIQQQGATAWATLAWYPFIFTGVFGICLVAGRLITGFISGTGIAAEKTLARICRAINPIMRWKSIPILSTAAIQAFAGLSFTMVLSAVHPPIRVAESITALALSSAVTILPVSIGGIGIREASNIGVLGHFHVPEPMAFAASLLDGFLLPILVLSLLIALTKHPKKLYP